MSDIKIGRRCWGMADDRHRCSKASGHDGPCRFVAADELAWALGDGHTAPVPAAPTPSHTDLMVTPESLDKYLVEHPPAAPAPEATRGVLDLSPIGTMPPDARMGNATPPEATRETDAPTNLALAHELERVAVWIAEREVRLPVGVPGDPLDIVRRAIGWLRGERREQMPDARWLIRHDATCHAIAALVRQESESARAALSRENETLRADKARLDWWEAHLRIENGTDCETGEVVLYEMGGNINDREWNEVARKPTLRDAIDAARAPEPTP